MWLLYGLFDFKKCFYDIDAECEKKKEKRGKELKINLFAWSWISFSYSVVIQKWKKYFWLHNRSIAKAKER